MTSSFFWRDSFFSRNFFSRAMKGSYCCFSSSSAAFFRSARATSLFRTR